MRLARFSLLIIAVMFFFTNQTFAGGAVARRRQMSGGNPQAQQQQMQQQQMQQLRQQQLIAIQQQVQAQQAVLDEQRGPEEVMDLATLSEELTKSSEVWTRIMDNQVKAQIVVTYINWYHQQGIVLQKSPGEYLYLLDSASMENPSMFELPFADVLRLLAIMEYDFNNGMNKDQMVVATFGQNFYQQNKKRLGRP